MRIRMNKEKQDDTNKGSKVSGTQELQDEELEGASGGKDWLASNFQGEIGSLPDSDGSTDSSGITTVRLISGGRPATGCRKVG